MTPAQLRPLAVVTGGSSGIGFELAREFAQNGYDLVICAEDAGTLAEAAQALSGLGEGASSEVTPVAADLTEASGVRTLYETVRDMDRPVDALCANAGAGVWGEFVRTRLADELTIIQLNVTSQVELIKLMARDMVERGRGHILITASAPGAPPGPRMAVYAGTEAFLNAFGHALRSELHDHGVGVTILAPGPTETAFFERAGMNSGEIARSQLADPAAVARKAFQALQKDRALVVAGAGGRAPAAEPGREAGRA
jgi:short-subunit dehydrogenase